MRSHSNFKIRSNGEIEELGVEIKTKFSQFLLIVQTAPYKSHQDLVVGQESKSTILHTNLVEKQD